jgi:hypothetical protein
MTPLAIELNDRALSLARDGEVLASAPSAAFDTTVNAPLGATPWEALRSQPMAVSTRHLGAVLTQRGLSARSEDILARELAGLLTLKPPLDGERVWIAAPARSKPVGLGAFFGITRGLKISVDGFVDAATVTAAALAPERNAIVLELGLHHAAATAVDMDAGQARRRRAVLFERAGLIELHQLWLDLVSTTMVKRTRFDPLHNAATEQQLFDALPALAKDLAATGDATASVTKGTERFEVTLTRDQFAQTAEPIFRGIIGLLHQLRPAGAPMTIIVPQPVLDLPGFRETLEPFVGCELIAVPDGFAATAISLLDLPTNTSDYDSTVRLLRRLPIRSQPVSGEPDLAEPGSANSGSGVPVSAGLDFGTAGPVCAHPGSPAPQLPDAISSGASRELLGKRRSTGATPSHVLFDGRAYALSGAALVVGRNTAPAPYRSLTLSDGLAGVSRRHCTFVHNGEDLVLLDHSSFGTFVNGERVQERVRVHAGDRVRLGEPGVELSLIAVGDAMPPPSVSHPPTAPTPPTT